MGVTYFRINAAKAGQFERMIIAEEASTVSYLEGCTAPMRDEHQLHAAVVEIYAHKMPPSNILLFKTGIPAMSRAKAASIILLRNAVYCDGANSKN
ncbi:MAG: hypothetical protein R3C26_26940 [Calditrichia bacterium]